MHSNHGWTVRLLEGMGSVISHWSAVAYVIDSPNQRQDSYIIHTQPTSANAADSYLFHTPADVGWKSGCANRDLRPEMIE